MADISPEFYWQLTLNSVSDAERRHLHNCEPGFGELIRWQCARFRDIGQAESTQQRSNLFNKLLMILSAIDWASRIASGFRSKHAAESLALDVDPLNGTV